MTREYRSMRIPPPLPPTHSPRSLAKGRQNVIGCFAPYLYACNVMRASWELALVFLRCKNWRREKHASWRRRGGGRRGGGGVRCTRLKTIKLSSRCEPAPYLFRQSGVPAVSQKRFVVVSDPMDTEWASARNKRIADAAGRILVQQRAGGRSPSGA